MAYDEALAARIRDLLADRPERTEKKMFGAPGIRTKADLQAWVRRGAEFALSLPPK